MFLLKHSVKAGTIMSEFHLRILTGISPFGVAFLLFILFIIPFHVLNIKIFKRKYF